MSHEKFDDSDVGRAMSGEVDWGDSSDGVIINTGALAEYEDSGYPELAPYPGTEPPPDPPMQTDFAHELAVQARASVAPDGSATLDDLHREVVAREIRRREANKRAPRVNVVPESIGRGIMGNTDVVTSGGQNGDCVFWEGSDDEARPVTISVAPGGGSSGGGASSGSFPTAQNSAGTPFSYRPYAIVRYGTRGNPIQVTVDIGRGLQMVVCGSSVYVSVGMDAAPTGRAAGTMALTAMLGIGQRQTTAPVTRTVYVDSLAAAGTSTFTIPTFATSLLPVQMDDGANAGQARMEVQDTNSTTITRLDVLTPGNQSAPMPLSNDAYQIKLTNSGANTTTYRFCFLLSL